MVWTGESLPLPYLDLIILILFSEDSIDSLCKPISIGFWAYIQYIYLFVYVVLVFL